MPAEDRSIALFDRLRPNLQADGGDLEPVHLDSRSVRLRHTGRCAGCPSAHVTLLQGVEQALRRTVPEVKDIRFTSSAYTTLPGRATRPAVVAQAFASPDGQAVDDSPVLGRSSRIRALTDFLRIIQSSDSTVLLTGESGTGKEVTAALIHRSSRRRARPFVPVSCALFSDTLIESELFGHERGAFTGAVKDRPGRFELAEGGTVFLDDIDDIPLSMQVKLLRVLQNRTVERLGGSRTIPVNVRVIAATKHDLADMVAKHLFREDLYYRLNVIPLALPPLRDRPEDIPILMQAFIDRSARQRGVDPPAVPDHVREAFHRYHWPGNVRELENACERVVQTCFCGTVGTGCLSVEMLTQPHGCAEDDRLMTVPDVTAGGDAPTPVDLDARLNALESDLLAWALETAEGNKSRAALLLKISRSTFGDRLSRSYRVPSADITAQAFAPDASSPLKVKGTTRTVTVTREPEALGGDEPRWEAERCAGASGLGSPIPSVRSV